MKISGLLCRPFLIDFTSKKQKSSENQRNFCDDVSENSTIIQELGALLKEPNIYFGILELKLQMFFPRNLINLEAQDILKLIKCEINVNYERYPFKLRSK